MRFPKAGRQASRPAASSRRGDLFALPLIAIVLVLSSFAGIAMLSPSHLGVGPLGAGGGPPTVPVLATAAVTAGVQVGPVSAATPLPTAFWGVNVAAAHSFTTSDAAYVTKTPVTWLRYPGGDVGEQLNFTSGVITSNSGSTSTATTSVAQFVQSCQSIHCNAIIQLPAEIDEPQTAAYYASYVVHTLNFQPAYWEIGNAPSGWTHFHSPWSKWGSGTSGNTTPVGFAQLVKTYIAAVLTADPGAHFLALGAGMGPHLYDKSWILSLVTTDGALLSGISVHSYVEGAGPTHPTDAQLLAQLTGQYALPNQVLADRQDILQGCPTCSRIGVFVTEINAAETNSYMTMLSSSFAGTLYLAAETVQGLQLHATNLDWFVFDGNYPGAWSTPTDHWQKQYYLFSSVLNHLQGSSLPTTTVGPSSFYAAATYSPAGGMALLLVNTNTTSSLNVSLAQSGIAAGLTGTVYNWAPGMSLPATSQTSVGGSITLAPESLTLLTVAASPSASSTHLVYGVVTDASNGAPLPGATVSAGTGSTTTTDSQGAYSLALRNGSYQVVASFVGYVSQSATVTVQGNNVPQSFSLTPNPQADYPLSGTVHFANGTMAPGATVTVDGGPSTATDSTGAYSLSLPNGTYSVVASMAGSLPSTENVTIAGAASVLNFTLFPAPGYLLSGTVVYPGNGSAVVGATVSLSPSQLSERTNGSGGFSFPVTEGKYVVTVSLTGYAPYQANVSVQATDQYVTLSLGPVEFLVQGVVLSVLTDTPVPGANVSVGHGLTARTDSSGEFDLSLPNGSYVLTITAPGLALQADPLSVNGHQLTENIILITPATTNQGLQLSSGTAIVLAVAIGAGTAVGGLELYLRLRRGQVKRE